MTTYTFDNGNIMKGDVEVGWFAPGLNNAFECLVAIKNILESHGHKLKVDQYRSDFEVVDQELCIRTNEGGLYITGHEDELNYAYFSGDMNCAKSCAKVVLEVIS
jgi:hypothetical protein